MSEYNYDNAPTNPHHGGKMTPTDMVRRIEELETKLAKAVDALEWFYTKQHASGESPRDCLQNGIYKARYTLAELTGGKDE